MCQKHSEKINEADQIQRKHYKFQLINVLNTIHTNFLVKTEQYIKRIVEMRARNEFYFIPI